jgi:acyl-coenzyme A thioesterase PaaI-like protein
MSVHQEWLAKLKFFKEQLHAMGVPIQLPPPSQQELQIEYLEIIPGKKIKGKFPFQQRFTNPIGTYQGGFLIAAMDDHFGPLSYSTAERPCTTLSLSSTFLKPFVAKMGHAIVEVEVLSKTKSFIFMRGTVTSIEGELLAHADSHVAILRDDQLNRGKA